MTTEQPAQRRKRKLKWLPLGMGEGAAPQRGGVEIGVFGGGSLEMRKSYFGDRVRLYGVDIDPASRAIEGEGIEIHIGDQGDLRFWESFRESVPVVAS